MNYLLKKIGAVVDILKKISDYEYKVAKHKKIYLEELKNATNEIIIEFKKLEKNKLKI